MSKVTRLDSREKRELVRFIRQAKSEGTYKGSDIYRALVSSGKADLGNGRVVKYNHIAKLIRTKGLRGSRSPNQAPKVKVHDSLALFDLLVDHGVDRSKAFEIVKNV